MLKISYWLYFGVTVWNICTILASTVFVLIIIVCSFDNNFSKNCFNVMRIGVILNGACFAILSILLTCTVIPLLYSLNKLSKGRMELTHGVKMLTMIFGCFTFCYSTRTLYDFLV